MEVDLKVYLQYVRKNTLELNGHDTITTPVMGHVPGKLKK